MQNPFRLLTAVIGTALTLWIWGLALLLFHIRWHAYERPGPPLREIFPYGEIRIGVDASYPPFAVATSDDLFGLDIDVGRAIAERLKIPVRFVNMGYDGLYDSIRADQVDVVISALLIDPRRTAEVRYTQPYFNAGLVLVSDALRPVLSAPEIAGQRLAFEFGSVADSEARTWTRRIANFETQPYELPTYALDAVRYGAADAALVDSVSYRLYIKQHPAWPASASYTKDALYAAAVRFDREAMWTAINRALTAIIEDGTLNEIIQRWL